MADTKELIRHYAKDGVKPSLIKSALALSRITGKHFPEVMDQLRSVDTEVNAVIAEI